MGRRAAVRARGILERAADLVDHAFLHVGLGEDRGHGFTEPGEVVHRHRQDVVDPSALELARPLGLHFLDGTTWEGAHHALQGATSQARLKDPEAPWRQHPATPN